jgi:uncharacterized membrane protein
LHHRRAMTMSGWDWRRFGSWVIISGQAACTLISLIFVFLFRDDAIDGGCKISAGNIQCVCPHLTNRCIICAFDLKTVLLKLSVDSML